jgi:hypothetical protein
MPPKAANELVSNVSENFDKARKYISSSPVGILLQIIVGIVVVVLVYWLSLFVSRSDNIVSRPDPNAHSTTTIVGGYAESSQVANTSYNTAVVYAKNYLQLLPSSNMKGGSQFTYSLWMNLGQPKSAIGKPIFMRGDKTQYTYNTASKNVRDYVAFCPLFEFGSNELDFNIRFNTSKNINEIMQITRSTSSDNILRRNIMSLLASQWFMITIVFEDNIPINDFENGISVKFYINDILYQSGTWAAMLKQNNGNLFLFPDGAINQCKLSSFNYHNYALSQAEILSNFQAGPSKAPMVNTASAFQSSVVLSDYNTMDIYNN